MVSESCSFSIQGILDGVRPEPWLLVRGYDRIVLAFLDGLMAWVVAAHRRYGVIVYEQSVRQLHGLVALSTGHRGEGRLVAVKPIQGLHQKLLDLTHRHLSELD